MDFWNQLAASRQRRRRVKNGGKSHGSLVSPSEHKRLLITNPQSTPEDSMITRTVFSGFVILMLILFSDGIVAAVCGDAICIPEHGENCSTCPIDCRCEPHQKCINAKCIEVGGCGDRRCAPEHGENCSTCPIDCRCEPHQKCMHNACIGMPPHELAPASAGPGGWCCRAGQVLRGSLRSCEETGGILFLTPQEAHHHCAAGSGRPGVP